MTGGDGQGGRSLEIQNATIGILNPDVAARQEADMGVFTKLRADNGLDVLGPAEADGVNDSFNARGAGADRVHSHTADFAAVRAVNGCEQRVDGSHTTQSTTLYGLRRPQPVDLFLGIPQLSEDLRGVLAKHRGAMPDSRRGGRELHR